MANQFWEQYTSELVELLTANSRLPAHTRNPNLLGAFAEAAVNDLVRNMIGSSRCTTGSITSHDLVANQEKLKQLDIVIWDSTPMPAIFDRAGFAIVPQQSVHGVIEVKRSSYPGVGKAIKETLDWVENHVDGDMQIKPTVTTAMNSGQSSKVQGKPKNQLFDPDPFHIAIGVICIREAGQKDSDVVDLVSNGRAVVLQELQQDGSITINHSHVAHLVEFIKQV